MKIPASVPSQSVLAKAWRAVLPTAVGTDLLVIPVSVPSQTLLVKAWRQNAFWRKSSPVLLASAATDLPVKMPTSVPSRVISSCCQKGGRFNASTCGALTVVRAVTNGSV